MANALVSNRRVVVSVPASTSNLGPGFDAFGCAVKLRNRFVMSTTRGDTEARARFSGPRAEGLNPGADNLVHRSAARILEHAGVALGEPPPPIALEAVINVPLARGLGSSSTAVTAGLLGANALLRRPLPFEEVLQLAIEIEGHPDNVTPCFVGGLTVSASGTAEPCYRRLRLSPRLCFVFVVPDYEVKTSEARRLLPREIPLSDAIANLSRTPLVLEALRSGDAGLLREAMRDRLHQPYRKPLFRGYDDFEAAAFRAGAASFCVSGAGPTLLAVCPKEKAASVGRALGKQADAMGMGAEVMELPVDYAGARVAVEGARTAKT